MRIFARFLLLAVFSCAVALTFHSQAVAGEAAFLELLEVLRDNGTISAEAYETLKAAAEAEAAGQPAAAAPVPATDVSAAAEKKEEKEDEGAHVSIGRGGLDVESADGDFALNLGGRLHIDAAVYDEDESDLGNGATVRRLRAESKGKFAKDWDFGASVEFAGNEVDMKSTYVTYTGFDPLNLTIGNVKEPFGLDELTSSNYITLMERNQVTETFAPGRNIGVYVSSYHERGLLLQGGFFGVGPDEDDENDEGWAFSGRTVWIPYREKTRLIHLGAAASYRSIGDAEEARFRARPDSRVTDVRLVDTDDIDDVDELIRYGAEFGSIYGPLSLQGEWIGTSVERGPGSGDLDFDGWYVLGSWFLTGESRGYKEEDGEFARVTPEHPLGSGGFGAWELGLRYSQLDLTDDAIIGGEQDLLAAGLNWYVNSNLRFMANYVKVVNVDRPGTDTDGDEPQIFQIRSQLHF